HSNPSRSCSKVPGQKPFGVRAAVHHSGEGLVIKLKGPGEGKPEAESFTRATETNSEPALSGTTAKRRLCHVGARLISSSWLRISLDGYLLAGLVCMRGTRHQPMNPGKRR